MFCRRPCVVSVVSSSLYAGLGVFGKAFPPAGAIQQEICDNIEDELRSTRGLAGLG
jgi:hypothetical protein